MVPAAGDDAIALIVTGEDPTEFTCVQLYVQDDDPGTNTYNEFGTVGPDPVYMAASALRTAPSVNDSDACFGSRCAGVRRGFIAPNRSRL